MDYTPWPIDIVAKHTSHWPLVPPNFFSTGSLAGLLICSMLQNWTGAIQKQVIPFLGLLADLTECSACLRSTPHGNRLFDVCKLVTCDSCILLWLVISYFSKNHIVAGHSPWSSKNAWYAMVRSRKGKNNEFSIKCTNINAWPKT